MGNALALTLFAMLIGLGFRRSKPAGYEVTYSDRLLVLLTSFAALGTGMSALRVIELPSEVLWPERIALIITSAAFYVAPLFLYLVAIRLQRQLKAVKESRSR